MEELLRALAGGVALAVEVVAAVIVTIGAAEALIRVVAIRLDRPIGSRDLKNVWLRFASWLVLGLEFQLAADIVRSSIAPTWDQVGQLAAIAAIRTFLNYFLTKDIESFGASGNEPGDAASGDRQPPQRG